MRYLVSVLFIAILPAVASADIIYDFHELKSEVVLARMTLRELPATSHDIEQLEFTPVGLSIWTLLPRFYEVDELRTTAGAQVIDDGFGGLTSSPEPTFFVGNFIPPSELNEFVISFDHDQQDADWMHTQTVNGQRTRRDGNWRLSTIPEPSGIVISSVLLFLMCSSCRTMVGIT